LDVVVSDAVSISQWISPGFVTWGSMTHNSPLNAGSKPGSLLTVPLTMGTMTSEEPVWPPTDMGASMATRTVKTGVRVGKVDIVEMWDVVGC
jgi:hypothetical protein